MDLYKDNNIVIRDMEEDDITQLVQGFKEQGWVKPKELYEKYFDEQKKGIRYVLIAEYNGEIAGYTTLLPFALTGPFTEKKVPEINDFNVLIKFQNKGIGNKILDLSEQIASKSSQLISLGVGLHFGYGAAQRIYIKRGYIPDGSGVWYKDKQLGQYENCCNDDDLVLYLSKSLRE